MAATSPTDCFDAAYQACKIALEHMTPVVLLTDAFVANGSGAFKLPEIAKLDPINPPYVPEELKGKWTPYMRAENGTRYWAVPGREGFTHILGGLEKDNQTLYQPRESRLDDPSASAEDCKHPGSRSRS